MKKILLIAVVLLMTSMLVFAGGGKDKAAAGSGEAPFVVDLSTLKLAITSTNPDTVTGDRGNLLRNQAAITRNWEDVMWLFPENFVDVTKYQRVTITCKYYDAEGEELVPADSMAQVLLINDIAGDWRGPAMGPGPNTPLKEQNVGGFSGLVNRDRGVRHGCGKAPAAILFQKAQDPKVAFIELTGIIFHNGDYKSN